MAVSFNLDGQAYSFPDWATESTQGQIKDILSAMAKQNGVSDASLKKLLKATDDLVDSNKDENDKTQKRADDQKKRDEKALKASQALGDEMKGFSKELSEFGDNLEAPTGFFGRVRDNLEADGEQLGAAFGRAAEITIAATAGAAGIVGGMSTYVFSQLRSAGDSINMLTKSGVGFNTTFAEAGLTTTQAIGNLGALGIGFQGAAELIKNSSAVVATQGFNRFNNTMKFAADVSEDLGMSFEDSMETFGNALSRRQSLINLGNVDQARVNQTVRTTVKMQTAYATALGASTEELQAFVDSLVRDNGLLTSSLLGMSDTVRNDVVAGIEVFASGMAAMGGKAGQDIASAFVEAGAAGAVGLSDAAVGIVTALPQMRGPLEDFAAAIQSGTLSQDDANAMVQDMTSSLGNLSDGEKQRIQQLARVGDESAKMMANAIAQFEQSESKLKDINEALGAGFKMDQVQKGTNNFNKIMAQVSGGAQNAFYTLFASPEILTVIEDAMEDILGTFGFGVDSMSEIAQEGGKQLGEKFVPMLKKAVTYVADIIKQFAAYVEPFFAEDGGGLGALFADMWDRVTDAAMGMLIKGVAGFAVALFGFSVAKEFAKSILMPQMTKFMGGMFDKASGALGGIVSKGAGKLTEIAGPQAGKLMEKVQGSKYGKMASDKLGGIMGKGDSATDKLSGAMTGGGKSGGFLAKIADAVKEFGDNKVVKGAASLTLLGGALALSAIGLKQFSEVDVISIVKAGAALYGLSLLANQLGKGSTGMIKGAAAMVILGAATIPLAAGLQLMNNVGATAIGALAASLTVLGVAGAVLGKLSAQIYPGALAIAALGASIIPLALSLQLMQSVGMETVGVLASSLATLGVAAAALGFGLPLILAGAAAIAALGVALIPFGLGAALAAGPAASLAESLSLFSYIDAGQLVGVAGGLLALSGAMTVLGLALPLIMLAGAAAEPIQKLGFALYPLSMINFANLLMARAALESLGSGMSALSGGSLMSSVKDGIGSLFGADSPIDKLRDFISELSKLDITPLLDTAYAFEVLLASSEKLPQFGIMLNIIAEYTEPFIDQMRSLSRSIEKMGEDPFAPFATLDTHAESMTTFATSAEQLTDALNAIDGEYVGDQFFAIGDGIQYMVEQMEQLNMGDMLKLGAMKLFGPSTEERQAADQSQTMKMATVDTAQEKLYGGLGFDGDGGLTRLLKGLTFAGDDVRDKDLFLGAQPSNYALAQATNLESYGVNVDRSAIKEGGETAQSEIANITKQLGTMIDAFKMQEKTGIIDQSVVPVTGQQPQPTPEQQTPQIPEAQQTAANNMTPMSQGGPTQIELLTELVRLQAENNRLAKKTKGSIDNIEV